MAPIAQPASAAKPGFDPDYLPVFEDKLFIEGPLARRRLVNFFVLLVLATVIATYGVLSDSTATVIGAMIVAPLMGPIMATTAAVVMGSLPRALRALALVCVGVVTVVACSYMLSAIVPAVVISFTGNGEITSRINPNLYALLTALGAGAAGAFITSRAEIADSIGGVAHRHLAGAPALRRRHRPAAGAVRPGPGGAAAVPHQLPGHPAGGRHRPGGPGPGHARALPAADAAPPARTTAPTATPGATSATTRPARAPTPGARTAWLASLTISAGSALPWPSGMATTRSSRSASLA